MFFNKSLRKTRPEFGHVSVFIDQPEVRIFLESSSVFRRSLFTAGAGDFYCSGNDLTNFTKIPEEGVEAMAKSGAELLR